MLCALHDGPHKQVATDNECQWVVLIITTSCCNRSTPAVTVLFENVATNNKWGELLYVATDNDHYYYIMLQQI